MASLQVLMLCVGNICRSPMAERLLVARLADRGVRDEVAVASAGMRAVVGSAFHPRSAADTRALGGDPDGFAARQAEPPMIQRAGLVLTASHRERAMALEETPSALRRTFTLREFATLSVSAPSGLGVAALITDCAARRSVLTRGGYDVPDPVNGPPAAFATAATLIDEATRSIADTLARALRPKLGGAEAQRLSSHQPRSTVGSEPARTSRPSGSRGPAWER